MGFLEEDLLAMGYPEDSPSELQAMGWNRPANAQAHRGRPLNGEWRTVLPRGIRQAAMEGYGIKDGAMTAGGNGGPW